MARLVRVAAKKRRERTTTERKYKKVEEKGKRERKKKHIGRKGAHTQYISTIDTIAELEKRGRSDRKERE